MPGNCSLSGNTGLGGVPKVEPENPEDSKLPPWGEQTSVGHGTVHFPPLSVAAVIALFLLLGLFFVLGADGQGIAAGMDIEVLRPAP